MIGIVVVGRGSKGKVDQGALIQLHRVPPFILCAQVLAIYQML